MKVIFVLDWYTSKYLRVNWVDDNSFERLTWGDKVVYGVKNNDRVSSSVWIYLWYDIRSDRDAQFERILEKKDKEYFDDQQKYALDIFPIFKETFKKSFPSSRPITARYQIYSHQVYFYFYSDERYVFWDYVKRLREKIWKNIFLFQVGARDMVRLSPSAKNFLTIDGRPLDAINSWPLPSVPMENIMLQNLDWRDVERLKWPSGKLKESISYETELYLEESKKYPIRWSSVKLKALGISGICLSFNIMSWDVTVKTDKHEIYRVPVEQLEFQNGNAGILMQRKDNEY